MFPRHIHPLLTEALADTPVVLINGARQTGKSTLAQALARDQGRRYLTLDDRVVLAAAKGDPGGFIAGLSGPVVMDEIQRAPELFLDIKAAVDRDRTPGRFLLTGSANVLLLPALADSLAGRMEILNLWPLSGGEMAGDAAFNRADWLFDGNLDALTVPPCDRATLVEALLHGGFPEAVARTSARRRSAWFESYLQTILQRDVRELANLERLTEVPQLLQLLATRCASLPGHLVESYVASELLKHLAFSGKGLALWHYRTPTDVEVDFVLEDRRGKLTGIEVKASAGVDRSDFRGLRHLQDTEAQAFHRGIVLYAGREIIPFSDRLFAVPLSMWWASRSNTK